TGPIRSSWHADGPGACGLSVVGPDAAVRPGPSRVGRSRSLRALVRARFDADLRLAPPLGLRSQPRRYPPLPAIRLQNAGPSRAGTHRRYRDYDRPAGPGRGELGGDGDRGEVPGESFQPA